MENNRVDASTAGYGVSYAVTIILSSVLIIIRDSYEPFKNWMKSPHEYYLMIDGFFVIVFFLVLGFFLSSIEIEKKLNSIALSAIVIVGTVIECILIMLTKAIY